MVSYFGGLFLLRFLIVKGTAILFLIAFVSARNQFKVFLGDDGLEPIADFLKNPVAKKRPTLFRWYYSDAFFSAVTWIGILLSLAALLGVFDILPWWGFAVFWLLIYFLYLSIVEVGQSGYSFGWESMLLEMGFFVAFLGPVSIAPSIVPVVALRWMLFRTELGAGLIKIRGDACWRNLTCLVYHHETQPLPNPLSWYVHQLPKFAMKGGVVFSHFAQLIVPFSLFLPQPFAAIGAAVMIFHQLLLIVSGNYSWLNWLTIVLACSALSDKVLSFIPFNTVQQGHSPLSYSIAMIILLVFLVYLSIQPAKNLFAKEQKMNYCWNRFHLVGAYGAFGSITKKRYEIVIEGTQDEVIGATTKWEEYDFKAKPGDLYRRPPQIAPYHLRLDWLMWFLPFSVMVSAQGVQVFSYEQWFLRFIRKLLQADRQALKLIKRAPFKEQRPTFLRARYYLYRFTKPKERKETKAIWKRDLVGDYFKPLSLEDLGGS